MGIFDFLTIKKTSEAKVVPEVEKKSIPQEIARPAKQAFSRLLFTHTFNGEKNVGEIGPARNYRLDYETLRVRSWQAFLESDIARTILGKYSAWVVGTGLKLQLTPAKAILEASGIEISQDFNKITEARFNLFCNSTSADFAGMDTLNAMAEECDKNATVGGDVLIILRYVNNCVKVQLIDGAHVRYPQGNETTPCFLNNGNYIIHGIEFSPNGQHVAYFVRDFQGEYNRIEARSPVTGLKVAWLHSGLKHRLDNVRGIPLISVVLETLKKLERYKEATVGSAEERQKIVYSIEHDSTSTGEAPFSRSVLQAVNGDSGSGIDISAQGEVIAQNITATTNKQAFNMTPGSKISTLDSSPEINFEGFYTPNANLICACLQIPPEVAFSKYDSNFSASRAALKDWENTLTVRRKKISLGFYEPIFTYWLETEILKGNITAPGYIEARKKGDVIIPEAYRACRFAGTNVPHIDPLKEANAVRIKLGSAADAIPLITVEEGTQSLAGGDAFENMEQFAEELERSKTLKIIAPITGVPDPKKIPKKKD